MPGVAAFDEASKARGSPKREVGAYRPIGW